MKTEKRCVVAPHDVDVSLGLSVSTTGYGDHNPVRDGSGDAVSGSGGARLRQKTHCQGAEGTFSLASGNIFDMILPPILDTLAPPHHDDPCL